MILSATAARKLKATGLNKVAVVRWRRWFMTWYYCSDLASLKLNGDKVALKKKGAPCMHLFAPPIINTDSSKPFFVIKSNFLLFYYTGCSLHYNVKTAHCEHTVYKNTTWHWTLICFSNINKTNSPFFKGINHITFDIKPCCVVLEYL